MNDKVERLKNEKDQSRRRRRAATQLTKAGPPDVVEAEAAAALERLLNNPGDREALREAVAAHGGGWAGWESLRERLEDVEERELRRGRTLADRLTKARQQAAQERRREQESDALSEREHAQAAFDAKAKARYREEHGTEPSAQELNDYIENGVFMGGFHGTELEEAPEGYTLPANRRDEGEDEASERSNPVEAPAEAPAGATVVS